MTMLSRSVRAAVWRARQTAEAATPTATTAAAAAIRTASRRFDGLAGEHFAFGRTDLDAALSLQLPGGRASATLRALATGLGQAPRYALQAEARVRLRPALYAVASAGSAFTPTPGGTLARGLLGALGLGVDFAR